MDLEAFFHEYKEKKNAYQMALSTKKRHSLPQPHVGNFIGRSLRSNGE